MFEMAPYLMDAPVGTEVDHINGNTLDNRRSINLRLSDHRRNSGNRGPNSNNTSGFKGVSFDKESGKYSANIRDHGKQKKLGRFPTAELAARAYDRAAVEVFGEFAWLNFPAEAKQ
jgi:hypothetical protein